ncbi:alpha/beta fold hydrolase [Dactylosporangium cerinum]|uniref:Alpha/beta fold hydrolase n=1 Tax=Dactylosporangium cerinum TaxID=1434730 RepID=A0ABV9VNY1_9ACTN
MTLTIPELTRWRIDGAEVAYTDSGGDGAPLLLIHAAGSADWFTPLAALPVLDRYRVIRMVRAGYTGAAAPGGLSIADHAGHAAALLRHLGAAPAHVLAHSSGTTIAMQLAFDHPDLVRTLMLSEPPLVDSLAAPEDLDVIHAMLGPAIGAAMAATARGDLPAAFDVFMAAVCGPSFREVMTSALGADLVAAAEDSSRCLFTGEIPAINGWSLDRQAAARLQQPVLLIQGSASPPPFHRLVAHLAGLISGATVATIDGGNHL